MAGYVDNATRDVLISAFRSRICDRLEIVPFPHQAAWWAASDGYLLTDVPAESGNGMQVQVGDERVWRELLPRPRGRAKVIADLGAFKIGKSFSSGLWAAAFACVPRARVQLVGLEYDICEPEFNYIVEALLSERGLGLKFDSVQNRPRDGKMWIDLPNGARYEAKSWERKDTLKGKEVDAYVYCEAFMLPGLECYTDFSQNLRVRDGYAVFATTPDRPWVNEIHKCAHSGQEEFANWHCTCDVHSSQNPYSFSQHAMDRDRSLMTREKFAIHYEGKLGGFVGRVYDYTIGARQFTPSTHPALFRGGSGDPRERLRVPDGWEIVTGADTGTFSSAAVIAFSPEGEAFVLDEFPNYDYRAGVPELDETLTIPTWSRRVANRVAALGGRAFAYADKNSQFKAECRNYGLHLESNLTPFEARTEISREYFQNGRIFLAPWLKILPWELENARWPEEASAAGKFARIKDRDHTLDTMEHVLSRRPRGKRPEPEKRFSTWAENWAGKPFRNKKETKINA